MLARRRSEVAIISSTFGFLLRWPRRLAVQADEIDEAVSVFAVERILALQQLGTTLCPFFLWRHVRVYKVDYRLLLLLRLVAVVFVIVLCSRHLALDFVATALHARLSLRSLRLCFRLGVGVSVHLHSKD